MSNKMICPFCRKETIIPIGYLMGCTSCEEEYVFDNVPFRKLLEDVKGIVIKDTSAQCNMTWAEVMNLVDSSAHLLR